MKIKVLIVEDSYYKFFTLKNLLKSSLKIDLKVAEIFPHESPVDTARNLGPNFLVYRPIGGVVEVLDLLKAKGINCRNAVVTVLLTNELSRDLYLELCKATKKKAGNHASSIARAA